MLLTQLKRSPVRWFVPFALALSLALLLLRSRYWIGVWPETSAAAQVSAILVAGLTAAAAAWSVGAPMRHGMVEQAAVLAMPRWRQEMPGVLSVVLYFASVALVVQAVGFALTLRTTPPGFGLWPGYVLMALVVTCLSVAFGHVVGKLLSGRFAAALAGLSWLIAGLYLAPLLDLSVLSGPVYNEVDTFTISMRLAAAIALMAVAVMVPPLARGAGEWASGGAGSNLLLFRSRPAGAVSAVGAGLLVTVAALGTPIVARQAPPEPLCQGRRMVVCLWPEHEKYKTQVAAIVERTERLPDGFVLPARLDEYGLKFRFITINGHTIYDLTKNPSPYFYLIEGSMWSISGTIAVEVIKRTLPFCPEATQTKGSEMESKALELQYWLEAYLVGGGQADYQTSATSEHKAAAQRGIDRANHGTVAEQFAWATALIEKFSSAPCR